ncbi:MAG TPA: hypothetical protein VL527_16900 [Dongiaceae bacterium]|nr:hypothetical protein [Dongiaceae bacterium]
MSWRVEFHKVEAERAHQGDLLDSVKFFAAKLPPEELIGVTHVLERERIIFAVWYWSWGSHWKCPQCGEPVEEQFDQCWNCSTAKPPEAGGRQVEAAVEPEMRRPESWQFRCRKTQGAWLTWDDFFGEVARLASEVGPERLIGLAHSGPKEDALATMFYWQDDYAAEA